MSKKKSQMLEFKKLSTLIVEKLDQLSAEIQVIKNSDEKLNVEMSNIYRRLNTLEETCKVLTDNMIKDI